jgi:hypothetical protein
MPISEAHHILACGRVAGELDEVGATANASAMKAFGAAH